jgi:hypothetical protein
MNDDDSAIIQIHGDIEKYPRIRSSVRNCLYDVDVLIDHLKEDPNTLNEARELQSVLNVANDAATRMVEVNGTPTMSVREVHAIMICLGRLLENEFDPDVRTRLEDAFKCLSKEYDRFIGYQNMTNYYNKK